MKVFQSVLPAQFILCYNLLQIFLVYAPLRSAQVPFCSHGGGRFGQSLTAITKLAPDSTIGEGLAISYSRGSGMPGDVAEWLEENGIAIH